MIALVAVETVVIILLVVLVAGLLRSHADILRALHDLGAGVGDGSADSDAATRRSSARTGPGPATIAGHTPDGGAVSLSLVRGRDTLVAFLSSGCSACAPIWRALAHEPVDAPGGARVVVVTRGPDLESASGVAEVASGARVTVVMSSEAFDAFDVPGAPYFVYVDGETGRVRGEGTARAWDQVVALGARALADEGPRRAPAERRRTAAARRRVRRTGSDRRREERTDRALAEAGIVPGDPRLHVPVADDAAEDAST